MNQTATVEVKSLRIGQLVRLSLRAADMKAGRSIGRSLGDDNEIKDYSSRIEDVDNDKLVISWPTERGVLVPASKRQSISLKVRVDGVWFETSATIVETTTTPIPVLHIAVSGRWAKTQLRHHVRFRTDIAPAEAVLMLRGLARSDERSAIFEALKTAEGKGEPFACKIVNISAGGVMLSSSRDMKVGDIIRIRFALEGVQPDILVLVRVVWAEDKPSFRLRYQAGCQFLDISSKLQDLITKYIFAKQVELRRRGLV